MRFNNVPAVHDGLEGGVTEHQNDDQQGRHKDDRNELGCVEHNTPFGGVDFIIFHEFYAKEY